MAIAQAEVEVAEARLGIAEQRLASTVIRAPTDGTILMKRAEVGSLINPTALQVAASLCDLADLRALEVDISVPERDLGRIAKGQLCTIRLEAFPQGIYKGRVARLLPIADRAKAAVSVRIQVEVPEGDERLRPEMSALVQILAKE